MLFSSWLRNSKRSAPAARRPIRTSSRQRSIDDRSFCEVLRSASVPGLDLPPARHYPDRCGFRKEPSPHGGILVSLVN